MTKAKPLPSVQYLNECFQEKNGRLYWKVRPRSHFADNRGCSVWNSKFPGKLAGCIQADTKGVSRFVVNINGKLFKRYHIVFAIHTGRFVNNIDHEDNNTMNDRIGNLREATHSQNMQNRGKQKNNQCGYKGVHKVRDKYRSMIRINKKRIHLGYFNDRESAYAAYCEAAKKYHGDFARMK